MRTKEVKFLSKKSGKYLKQTAKRHKAGKPITAILIGIIVLLVVAMFVMLWFAQGRSAYQMIVHDGYKGTQEQWLASLVGEETDGSADTAYELAVKNGYKGSETEWIEAIVGVSLESVNTSPYKLACEHGFEGSLSEWLTGIADTPEMLGQSDNAEQRTEYELACEYGYSGTFIEWLVSVTHDRVFN